MTDEELADELIERLKDFSPAVSIAAGEDDVQVIVEITMSRTPYSAKQLARVEAGLDPEL